jgi:ankyrin repeat protein
MNKEYNYEELAELIEKHDFEPVKNWLKASGDPNIGLESGKDSLLTYVIDELFENPNQEDRLLELFKLFLECGAAVNTVDDPGRLLVEAIRVNNRAVKLLVDYGADCNVLFDNFPRQTPLLIAAEENNLELVKILLPQTSQETLHVCKGIIATTALGFAFENLNEEMIEILLKAGANPYFVEWDHGYIRSMDIRPLEGGTHEQENQLKELVEKYSQYPKG